MSAAADTLDENGAILSRAFELCPHVPSLGVQPITLLQLAGKPTRVPARPASKSAARSAPRCWAPQRTGAVNLLTPKRTSHSQECPHACGRPTSVNYTRSIPISRLPQTAYSLLHAVPKMLRSRVTFGPRDVGKLRANLEVIQRVCIQLFDNRIGCGDQSRRFAARQCRRRVRHWIVCV
jgi:hypothetical protein